MNTRFYLSDHVTYPGEGNYLGLLPRELQVEVSRYRMWCPLKVTMLGLEPDPELDPDPIRIRQKIICVDSADTVRAAGSVTGPEPNDCHVGLRGFGGKSDTIDWQQLVRELAGGGHGNAAHVAYTRKPLKINGSVLRMRRDNRKAEQRDPGSIARHVLLQSHGVGLRVSCICGLSRLL